MKLLEKNREFFDAVASIYDNKILRKWLINIQNNVLKEIKINKNARILDVGCGTGNLLLRLSNRKDLKLYGIDISEKMLEIAKKKLGNKAKLKLMPAEKLNFKEKFDYIFSTEAFHHYANQGKVMKNFYRILKKNGLLVIADVDFGFFFNKIFHLIEPGNNKVLNKEEFRKLFKKHNFKEIKQKELGLFSIFTEGEK